MWNVAKEKHKAQGLLPPWACPRQLPPTLCCPACPPGALSHDYRGRISRIDYCIDNSQLHLHALAKLLGGFHGLGDLFGLRQQLVLALDIGVQGVGELLHCILVHLHVIGSY